MDNIRIAQIDQKFLRDQAICDWTPSRLDVDLHNTIIREYPDLDSNLRFHITQVSRVRADGPLEVHVEISQVVGNVKLRVPSRGNFERQGPPRRLARTSALKYHKNRHTCDLASCALLYCLAYSAHTVIQLVQQPLASTPKRYSCGS
jgi:hypothetical protein